MHYAFCIMHILPYNLIMIFFFILCMNMFCCLKARITLNGFTKGLICDVHIIDPRALTSHFAHDTCRIVTLFMSYFPFRTRFTRKGFSRALIFGALYLASYLAMFVYQNVLLDPRDVIFINSIVVASGIVGINIVGELYSINNK